MSENEPAQMIEGRYRIVRNIAEGGMATVYEAVDERLGRTSGAVRRTVPPRGQFGRVHRQPAHRSGV